MTVERARADAVPAITTMLRRLHDACGLTWAYDAPSMSMFLAGVVADNLCLVLRDPHVCGVFVATAGRPPWGGPEMAIEWLWWVDEGHRSPRAARAFLDGFEAWAAERGIRHLSISSQAVSDPRLGTLYERRGYRCREAHFIKTIEG